MNKKDDRPTFYHQNDKGKPIRAGGVLFYKLDKDAYKLLLIYSRNNYEDFGGCTDNIDKNIKETVSREVAEESNFVFSQKFVQDKLNDEKSVYITKSKYILYFIELKEDYDPNIFGDKEHHDGFDRTVEWIPYSEFDDLKLNWRLKNWTVSNYMKSLFI